MIHEIIVKEDIKYLASFTRTIRKEIGANDKWTCTGPGGGEECILVPILGKAANFFDGFMVNSSHKDHERNSHYNKRDNGEIRCICCHWWSHKKGGDEDYALLLEGLDVLTEKARVNMSEYPLVSSNLGRFESVFEVVDFALRLKEKQNMVWEL